jgi:DNA-binding NarL/FixJ family response regulator
VHTLRTAGTAGHRSAVAPAVAVVSGNELLARRIREALELDTIEVVDWGAGVPELSDGAARAGAIVLVGGRATEERRALIRASCTRFPAVPAIVVASLSSTGVHKALEAGAAGLVLDSEIETALAATIHAVAAGQIVVPNRFRRHAIRPALSHREKQTLALVAAGYTNRQIAAHLFLAESTVKTHLTSVFGKLGVGSRSEAAELVLDPDMKLGISMPGVPTETGAANGNGSYGL